MKANPDKCQSVINKGYTKMHFKKIIRIKLDSLDSVVIADSNQHALTQEKLLHSHLKILKLYYIIFKSTRNKLIIKYLIEIQISIH